MPNLANRLRLRDFRLIHTVSETGQLALAAERLGMTQPAASRMLTAIEKTVGSRVFTRHPKGMTPTAVGEVLARNAVALLNTLDHTVQEVDAVGSGRAGTVRVGAVTGGAVAFVVPAVQRLKRDAAGADIHVDVAPSGELIEGLLRGDYDFVLSRIPHGTDSRQFTIRRGRVEVVGFVVRAGHPLATGTKLHVSDLAGYDWVIQGAPTPMRQAVEEAFFNNQVPLPREIVNTTSLLVMLAYVTSTDSIAPISREVGELLGPAGIGSTLQMIDLDEPIIVHPYHLICRRDQQLGPLAARLRDFVFAALSGEA